MLKGVLSLILALAITIGTAWINPSTDERTMYGHEGPVEQNWQPREVAGWPAPYLADNPNTSVIHNVGVEDNFRAGSFYCYAEFLVYHRFDIETVWILDQTQDAALKSGGGCGGLFQQIRHAG